MKAARKMTVMERFRLRVLFLEGVGPEKLAAEFRIDRSTVSRNTTCKGFRAGTGLQIEQVARLHSLWTSEAKGKGMELSLGEIADMAIIISARRSAGGLVGFAQSILSQCSSLAEDIRSNRGHEPQDAGNQQSAF